MTTTVVRIARLTPAPRAAFVSDADAMSSQNASARRALVTGALAVVMACSLPVWRHLGTRDLQNDEAIYSYAVDRIVETGDWLTPRAIPFDNAFLEKPPLKFWLVAGPMALGIVPRTEAGMRAVDALLGSIVFLYVYLLGYRLGGVVCGVVAAAVLVTMSPVLFDHGLRSNNMEAATMAAYCGGVFHLLRWAEGSKRDALWTAAWFVLGFMTKFVAVLFLPLACVLSLVLTAESRALLQRRWREWLVPSIVAAAAIVPWFAWQTVHTRGVVWHIMLTEHVYERFTHGLDPHHLQPWSFYLTETWKVLDAAGTAWLVVGGLAALGWTAGRRNGLPARLVLAWGIVPFALISGGRSKLLHYAYPFLPAFALGAGLAVSYVWRFIARGPLARLTEWVPPGPLASLRLPAAVREPVRMVCVAVALAAVAVAFATVSFGPLEWRRDGARVFTNASLSRPIVLALVAGWLAGYRRALPAALGTAVVVLLLPLTAYRGLLAEGTDEPHPLRAIRDCAAALPDATGRAVVFTPVPGLPHPYYYYLRHTGDWRWARRAPPDEIRARAEDPGERTLLILSQHDFARVAANWSALLTADDRPRATSGVGDRGEAQAPVVPVSPYPGYVILLPGAYRACVDAVQAAGGAIMYGTYRVEAGT